MNRNSPLEDDPSCTPEPSTGKAILENDRLTDLFGDDPEIISSMLEIYLESQAELMKELTEALSRNLDLKQIRLLAHTIKGSALNFGANALSEQAAIMENACKGDDAEDMQKAFLSVQELSQKTSDAIEDHIANCKASRKTDLE